jgi:hypothetical protein
MNLKKIRDVFGMTGGGTIVNIEKTSNDLNMDIEVFGYLAEHFNKQCKMKRDRKSWILKYKLIDLKKIEIIDDDNEIYTDDAFYGVIPEILNMEFKIVGEKIGEKEDVILKLWSYKNGSCMLHIWAKDIKIYNKSNHEIEYNELTEFYKEYQEKSKYAKK